MTITTTQVSAEDALRAVAEGRQIQMAWVHEDGGVQFCSLNQNIHDIMKIADGFLIVETMDGELTDIERADKILSEGMAKASVSSRDLCAMMKAHASLMSASDEEPETAENDETAEETPEIAEEIAGSQQNFAENCENAAEPAREPRKKLDDGKITALFHAGWSAEKIADEIGASKQAVYAHLKALREEGRL